MNDPNQVQLTLANGPSHQVQITQDVSYSSESVIQQAVEALDQRHIEPHSDSQPRLDDHHHQINEVSVLVKLQKKHKKCDQSHNVSVKKEKKREAIDGQAREIIFKVIKFFESEKLNRGYSYPVENVMKRASAATGLSESTIKRIKRDGLKAEATNTKMAGPKKKRVRKCKVQLDYYQLCALRGIVNGYFQRKEIPTLSKILLAAKNELNYRGGKESLRLILLNKLGIKFKKCDKKEKKPDVPAPMIEQKPQMSMPIEAPILTHNHVQMHYQPQMPEPMQHIHQQMHPMKMEDNCVYTNIITQSIMPC